MTEPRRGIWFAKDARFLSDPKVVELGELHGPGGPLAMDALLGMAKLVDAGGVIKSGYRALARLAFLSGPDEARAIVADLARVGLVELRDEGDIEFTVAFPQWDRYQQRARHAARQQEYRQRQTAAASAVDDEVTPGDVEVTPPADRVASRARKTGTRTETATGTGKAEASPAAQPSSSQRLDRRALAADLFAYWQAKCDHPHAKLTRDRHQKIEARLREGYTPEQIRTAIDGAAAAAFVNDAGRRFDDIELICRNGSKVEDFIARATPPAPGAGPPGSGRRLSPGERASQQARKWLADAEALDALDGAETEVPA